MPQKILFDGLNLSMKEGTRVATYTRVTAGVARAAGHETTILYSRAGKPPKRRLAREVVFFDEEPGRSGWSPAQLLLQGLDQIAGLLGTRATRVPLDGAVLTQPLGSRWVAADHVYAAPSIFNRAYGRFALFNLMSDFAMDWRPDIAHWTFPLPLRSRYGANIYTIHDLVPLRLPYTTLDHKRIYLRLLAAIGKKADHIVTVSEHSRQDIIRYLGVEAKRVTNTYEAVDIPDRYRNKPEDVLAAELEGLFRLAPRGYFLFYGALEPKKNIGRLLQAYLGANVDLPLVMILSRSWLAESEDKFLGKILQDDREKPGARQRVMRFDYMPFPLLMTLIKGARGVIFPSLYEGFGLPVLEAMTMATPVITANTSSIPEIAGDAALLVDPYDTEALRKAIIALARDDSLAAELSARGQKQAENFSLGAYRSRLDALYTSLSR